MLSSDTSACLPDASTSTKKYWKGLDRGMMGPHMSPCSRSRGGGSSCGNFHCDALIENLPWAHALHRPICSASRVQRGCLSKMGIIRLNIVAPGRPSLPCQSPDFVGVSPTNTTSIACALVPQVTTAGPLWGRCLLGGASDSTLCALRRRSAFMTALDLFNFAPAAGSWSLKGRAGTWSRRNPGARL